MAKAERMAGGEEQLLAALKTMNRKGMSFASFDLFLCGVFDLSNRRQSWSRCPCTICPWQKMHTAE
jgi:hypothetical protein